MKSVVAVTEVCAVMPRTRSASIDMPVLGLRDLPARQLVLPDLPAFKHRQHRRGRISTDWAVGLNRMFVAPFPMRLPNGLEFISGEPAVGAIAHDHSSATQDGLLSGGGRQRLERRPPCSSCSNHQRALPSSQCDNMSDLRYCNRLLICRWWRLPVFVAAMHGRLRRGVCLPTSRVAAGDGCRG